MAWSLAKTLKRTGAPALGMFIAKSVFDVARAGSNGNTMDIIWMNALGLTAVWLCVAVVMFVLMNLFVQLRRAR